MAEPRCDPRRVRKLNLRSILIFSRTRHQAQRADYVLPAAPAIEAGDIGRANDDRRIVWVDRLIDPPGEAKPDAWIWTELGASDLDSTMS